MNITQIQLGTILAALRYWQETLDHRGIPSSLEEIVTNAGEFEPLDVEEIDALCEDLNCSSVSQLRVVNSKAMALISSIARMTKEGEDDGAGGEFIMENDDAWDTVHDLINSARSIVGAQADKPVIQDKTESNERDRAIIRGAATVLSKYAQ